MNEATLGMYLLTEVMPQIVDWHGYRSPGWNAANRLSRLEPGWSTGPSGSDVLGDSEALAQEIAQLISESLH